MIKGSCLCKAVRFEIDGAVVMSRYCHCTNCRKFSGTAQSAWGLAKASEFRVTRSAADVHKYDAGSGGLRAFCVACGSSLWFEPAQMPDYLGIALGAIDEGDVGAPSMHVWTQSSPDWETITDDLPKHPTHP